MSISTHESTIRQWVKNHTKDEIAVFVESQIAARDAEIERLNGMISEFCNTVADMTDIPPSNEDVAYGRFEAQDEQYKRMRHALCVAGEQLLKRRAAYLKEKQNG